LNVIDLQGAVDSVQAAANPTTVDAAYAQVVLAQNELDQAIREFEPYADKPVSNLTRAFLQSELAAAQQQFDAASRYYNSLISAPGDLDLELAESQLAEAKAALAAAITEQVRAESSPYPLGIEEDLMIMQNAVERAQILFDQANLFAVDVDDAIADAQIIAPFDGTILFLGITEGRPAQAFQRAVVVGDTTQLEVQAELTGQELTGLTEGMVVMVDLFNAPGVPVEGVIRQLPSFSNTNDDANQLTRIELETRDFELNARVRIKVVIESKEAVLWLPPQAVRQFEGRNFVVLQEDDGQRRVDVKLGIVTGDRVEILFVEGVENLSEGQAVVGP
jgi:multidrug resistance efflux pump